MEKNLVIINNEKCSVKDNNFYCENLEISSLSENLKNKYNIKFILRKGDATPVYKLDKSKTKISSNILFFTKNLFVSMVRDKANYLIISITPYTFYSFLILLLFRKKIFLYLRSDGKKEISLIFGRSLSFLYKIIENFMSKFSNLIVVNKLISKKEKYFLVNPSQIDKEWLTNSKIAKENSEIKLLYVGRFKIEKGIYSLINLFKKVSIDNKNISLTLVGQGNRPKVEDDRIKFLHPISDKKKLIEEYDRHKILILPSYTEGHPQVLLESLVRQRPVIVFQEIKHVVENYQGVFVCERDYEQLTKTINYIDKNYEDILKGMSTNNYPTKENFFGQLSKILG